MEKDIEKIPETFEDMMDFLAKDEEEAIDGYEKVIAKLDDEHIIKELRKIETEEKAHKAFLLAVKDNPEAVYVEPLEQEEEPEEAEEEPKEEASYEVFNDYFIDDWDTEADSVEECVRKPLRG